MRVSMTGLGAFWKRHWPAVAVGVLAVAVNASGWAQGGSSAGQTPGGPQPLSEPLSGTQVGGHPVRPPRAVRVELNRTEALLRRQIARLPADADSGVALIREPERVILRVPSGLLFPPDSVTLRQDHTAAQLVSLMAQPLKRRRRLSAEIVVYTDSIGGSSLNATLSAQRAAAIDAAVGTGIASARLQARGAGDADALASNDTPAGRTQNRRIEIMFERGAAGARAPLAQPGSARPAPIRPAPVPTNAGG
jgi:outer membrane protein OmpA-like peptidoglycan-associated protein